MLSALTPGSTSRDTPLVVHTKLVNWVPLGPVTSGDVQVVAVIAVAGVALAETGVPMKTPAVAKKENNATSSAAGIARGRRNTTFSFGLMAVFAKSD